MNLELKGKNAIVTGASRGIGLAIADGLAREGANVAICGRTAKSLERAATSLSAHGTAVHALRCDVGVPGEIETFIDQTAEALGGIDILVNNPSGFGGTDDEEGWQQSVDIDLMGLVRTTRHALPHLETTGGGAILHISSISGIGSSSELPYGAVKAAVIHLTASQARAHAGKNIRVNCVAPGSVYFEGGLWDQVRLDDRETFDSVVAEIPFGRMGTPEEIANGAVFLCSGAAGWITGQTMVIDGGQIL